MTYLRESFIDQKAMAKSRGIPFLLSFDEWLLIWEQSGHLHERGRKNEQYVMARCGDVGPYAVDNVDIITCNQNSRIANTGNADSQRGRFISEEAKRKMSEAHLGKKREPHSEETKRKIGAGNRAARYRKRHLNGLMAAW